MKKYVNGNYIEMTQDEIIKDQNQSEQVQKNYWQSVDYGEAINSEIRKKYTESEEFALLRQREEKADEYNAYYEYCENCKIYVKEQIVKYKGGEV